MLKCKYNLTEHIKIIFFIYKITTLKITLLYNKIETLKRGIAYDTD